VDEPDLLVQSLNVTPKREKKTYKGASNRATQGVSFTDPTITFAFDAYVGNSSGFAIKHPGTLVTSLANFAAARHGFNPEEGIMVYEDPTDEYTNDDPDKIKFTITQYPFVNND